MTLDNWLDKWCEDWIRAGGAVRDLRQVVEQAVMEERRDCMKSVQDTFDRWAPIERSDFSFFVGVVITTIRARGVKPGEE